MKDGQTKSAEGKDYYLKMANGIGIGLIDRTEGPVMSRLLFNSAGIGGPSAGLMLIWPSIPRYLTPASKWPYRCRYSRNH